MANQMQNTDVNYQMIHNPRNLQARRIEFWMLRYSVILVCTIILFLFISRELASTYWAGSPVFAESGGLTIRFGYLDLVSNKPLTEVLLCASSFELVRKL